MKNLLINKIKTPTIRKAEDILSKAGAEDIFEKAKHQDGDIHPNGKWVWVASANGGKGDWRANKGNKSTKTSNVSSKVPNQKSDKERINLQQEYSTLYQLTKKPSTSAIKKKEFQRRMKEIEDMGLSVVRGKFKWRNVNKTATPSDTTKNDNSKQKKLRPVGTGTNGPERRRKDKKTQQNNL